MSLLEELMEMVGKDALYTRMEAQAKAKKSGRDYIVIQQGKEEKFKAIPKAMLKKHQKKGWNRV